MFHTSEYPAANRVRTYDIEAISLPIVYNKFGDHDPNGLMYVLAQDSERIQRRARENFALSPPQPYEEVRPLVIRANVGDEVKINFRNRLDRRASIHVQGLRYNVLNSDGADVGENPDTTTDRFIQYTWYVFHLHNHQWRRELDDSRSTIIDSVSISPQECMTLDILYGAGSFNGMIGDAIFSLPKRRNLRDFVVYKTSILFSLGNTVSLVTICPETEFGI